jgi:hypothetical protein
MRFRRDKGITLQAKDALKAAEESRAQADDDLAHQLEALDESEKVTKRMREHNAANNWDSFLLELLTGR